MEVISWGMGGVGIRVRRSSILKGGDGLKLGKCGMCLRKKIYIRSLFREKVRLVSYLFLGFGIWKFILCLFNRVDRILDERVRIYCG